MTTPCNAKCCVFQRAYCFHNTSCPHCRSCWQKSMHPAHIWCQVDRMDSRARHPLSWKVVSWQSYMLGHQYKGWIEHRLNKQTVSPLKETKGYVPTSLVRIELQYVWHLSRLSSQHIHCPKRWEKAFSRSLDAAAVPLEMSSLHVIEGVNASKHFFLSFTRVSVVDSFCPCCPIALKSTSR